MEMDENIIRWRWHVGVAMGEHMDGARASAKG
jgi:hypothetical protein